MKVSGSLDLAGLEYVADLTALNALTDLFEGRIVNMAGTVYIYSGGWRALAAGDNSVPTVAPANADMILRSDGTIAAWDDQYPDDTGASGKFLQSDGSGGVSWEDPPATLPAQAGNAAKYLTTDGTAASWSAVLRAGVEAGTANHVLINDGSGNWASEAALAASRGGLGTDASGFTGFVKASAGSFTAGPLAAGDMPSGIDAAKIGSGNVTSAEFEHIASLTSDAQTQLDAKLARAGGTMTGAITLAADPANALEAATKQYVDNVASALKVKNSVFVATDGNITLSGPQTIGSQGVVAGDRVLVRAQTAAAQNGIYVVRAGAWDRATDANTWNNLRSAFCFVEEGDYADTGWVCTINAGGTLETTAVTWAQFSGAGTYTAGNGLQLSGTTFSARLDGSTLAVSGSGLKVSDNVTLQTPSVAQYTDFAAIATPSAPGSGVRVYAKADGKIYKRATGEAESILGGGLVTDLKSTTFTAAAGYHYLCNTAGGAFTATLPTGAAGAVIRFSDDTRSWANYNLTLAPQTGQTIANLSASESLVCDLSGAHVQLAWDGTRWVLDTTGYAANVNTGVPNATASTPGLYVAGQAPGYTGGTISSSGYIGYAAGTAKTATGGRAINFEATTNLTSTPADVIAVTLNKGVYLVAGCTSISNHASASNLVAQIRIGSTAVAPTGRLAVGVATSAEGAISVPATPIVIETDGTVLNYRVYNEFSAGTTSRAMHLLSVIIVA